MRYAYPPDSNMPVSVDKAIYEKPYTPGIAELYSALASPRQ
jgi:hypothetical protein